VLKYQKVRGCKVEFRSAGHLKELVHLDFRGGCNQRDKIGIRGERTETSRNQLAVSPGGKMTNRGHFKKCKTQTESLSEPGGLKTEWVYLPVRGVRHGCSRIQARLGRKKKSKTIWCEGW